MTFLAKATFLKKISKIKKPKMLPPTYRYVKLIQEYEQQSCKIGQHWCSHANGVCVAYSSREEIKEDSSK